MRSGGIRPCAIPCGSRTEWLLWMQPREPASPGMRRPSSVTPASDRHSATNRCSTPQISRTTFESRGRQTWWPFRDSGQDFLEYFAANIRQAPANSVVVIRQAFVVDTQQGQDGVFKIVPVDPILNRLISEVVSCIV